MFGEKVGRGIVLVALFEEFYLRWSLAARELTPPTSLVATTVPSRMELHREMIPAELRLLSI
jgi:hypothetical protein